MARLLRFSFRFYVGGMMFMFAVSHNRDVDITANDIMLAPLAAVGLVWCAWALGEFGPELAGAATTTAELTRAVGRLILIRLQKTPSSVPPRVSPQPRLIRIHDAHGTRQIALPPTGDLPYRDFVGHFVIRGEQLGSYTARAMIGRRICGRALDFRLWETVTDESYVFRKGSHGTRLVYPARETLDSLAAGLPLANEAGYYPPDAVSVE